MIYAINYRAFNDNHQAIETAVAYVTGCNTPEDVALVFKHIMNSDTSVIHSIALHTGDVPADCKVLDLSHVLSFIHTS